MAHTISSAAHLDFMLFLLPADALLQGCNSLSIARSILCAEHGTRKENHNTTTLTDVLFPPLRQRKHRLHWEIQKERDGIGKIHICSTELTLQASKEFRDSISLHLLSLSQVWSSDPEAKAPKCCISSPFQLSCNKEESTERGLRLGIYPTLLQPQERYLIGRKILFSQ